MFGKRRDVFFGKEVPRNLVPAQSMLFSDLME